MPLLWPFLVNFALIVGVWLIGAPILTNHPGLSKLLWALTLAIPLIFLAISVYITVFLAVLNLYREKLNTLEEKIAGLDSQNLKSLLDSCSATSSAVANVQRDVETLPQYLRLNALLMAIADTIRHGGDLRKLCESGLVAQLAREKVRAVERDICGIDNLRLEFRAAFDFLGSLGTAWPGFVDSDAFRSLSFCSLEWVPEEGTFPSPLYADVYYKSVMDQIIGAGKLERRFFAHTESFENISGLEGYFLEDERVKSGANEIRIMHYKRSAHRDIAFRGRDYRFNLLLAYRTDGEAEAPAFVIRTAMGSSSEEFEAMISVNEDDMEKTKSLLWNQAGVNVNFDIEVVDKIKIKNKIQDTPQGEVFNRMRTGLQDAEDRVWATDISACVLGNGIERWKSSVFYRDIENMTDDVAFKLYSKNSNVIDDEHGFTRIYIVDLSTHDRASMIKKYVGSVAEKEYIRTIVIDVEQLRDKVSMFPDGELTDFHIVDDKRVAKLDIGPRRSYNQSDLFALPAHRRREMQQDAAPRQHYVDSFFLTSVEQYVYCFRSLLRSQFAVLVNTANDVTRFIEERIPDAG